MGRLYLVRHGRTAWNSEEVFRGLADIPLDEVGRRQAAMLRDALSTQAPETAWIVSSPLMRGLETARVISEAFPHAELRADPSFTDIDVGEWSGLTLSEVRSRYPELLEKWMKEPHLASYPGGQALREVQDRAWSGVRALLPVLRESDVILVSHRLVLKTVILKVVGAGLENFWSFRLDTGSISILETGRQGEEDKLALCRLNDTSHLASLGIPDKRDF